MSEGRVWRHKARGSVYTILGESGGVVYYVAHANGRMWWRPRDEFYDGRFEAVNISPLSADEMGFERG